MWASLSPHILLVQWTYAMHILSEVVASRKHLSISAGSNQLPIARFNDNVYPLSSFFIQCYYFGRSVDLDSSRVCSTVLVVKNDSKRRAYVHSYVIM